MGVVFFIAYLAFVYLCSLAHGPKIQNVIIALFLPVIVLQGAFLAFYSLNYERVASNAASQDFRPRYGLTQSTVFNSITCERLVFVEPRPTFTAAYWNLGCREYAWTSTPEKFNFEDGDYAVFNPAKYAEFENSRADVFMAQQVRAWFDPKGDYGSVFVFLNKVDD